MPPAQRHTPHIRHRRPDRLPGSPGRGFPAPSDTIGIPRRRSGSRQRRHDRRHGGDPLGLTGFGASAHLVLQIARLRFPRSPIYVFARNAAEREFARSLGANWTGDTTDTPPSEIAAIIDTTPAWKPVVEALPRLMAGGRLVINAIRKMNSDRDELARIDYATGLWMEREIKSVANVTRLDVKELLSFAASARLRPVVNVIPLDDANIALERLAAGVAVRGATVLDIPRASGSSGKP
jgi:propanol-preferring alcohol dehydrogenase